LLFYKQEILVISKEEALKIVNFLHEEIKDLREAFKDKQELKLQLQPLSTRSLKQDTIIIYVTNKRKLRGKALNKAER
jgi:mRNA-degrading endonuclease YafQ of YafQ-DinJ toxin-antitoxin module